MNLKSNLQLDLRGLKCPLPVLKTRKAMREMVIGERLEVMTTDPLAVIDMPAFCNEAGHQLLQTSELEDGHTFLIEKAA